MRSFIINGNFSIVLHFKLQINSVGTFILKVDSPEEFRADGHILRQDRISGERWFEIYINGCLFWALYEGI